MRISDWSSDVCSSDLELGVHHHERCGGEAAAKVGEGGRVLDQVMDVHRGSIAAARRVDKARIAREARQSSSTRHPRAGRGLLPRVSRSPRETPARPGLTESETTTATPIPPLPTHT